MRIIILLYESFSIIEEIVTFKKIMITKRVALTEMTFTLHFVLFCVFVLYGHFFMMPLNLTYLH